MMLVYNLGSTQAIFRRVGGVDGSAYLVGGFGFTALTDDEIIVVPIRSGPRRAARRCPVVSQVHAAADLEPVLITPGAIGHTC